MSKIIPNLTSCIEEVGQFSWFLKKRRDIRIIYLEIIQEYIRKKNYDITECKNKKI